METNDYTFDDKSIAEYLHMHGYRWIVRRANGSILACKRKPIFKRNDWRPNGFCMFIHDDNLLKSVGDKPVIVDSLL